MSIKIVYFSRTGNIQRFIKKLENKGIKNIVNIIPDIKINGEYILIIPTINFGEIPIEYKKFLKVNSNGIIGVSGSGNRNWGSNFAIAADKVSKKFSVPIISKFELSGNEHDVNIFIKKFKELENGNQTYRIK